MNVHPYYHSTTKRVFDVVLASSLIVFLSPLWMLIAAVVVVTSGWPVIYQQRRLGQHKRPFWLYKFRVMYVGADKHQWRYRHQNEAPEPMYKNWRDPRYVGVGKWLSRTGLDELPQLINILKGEMSLVGPRPLPVKEAEKLDKSWNFRYQVRPGVFSEWSTAAHRHLSLSHWIELDRKTLKCGGWWYEFNLIVKTLTSLYRI